MPNRSQAGFMRTASTILPAWLTVTGFVVSAAQAQENPPKPAELTRERVAFFETYIRPVLAERCYECHSAQAKAVKGNLRLDSQAGLAKGGDGGPVIVPGDVEKSRLIEA